MISIIIPVYNASKYLEACLDSCLAQTFVDFEIIAVNDGSSDNSAEILKRYEKVDQRIKVISKENQGLVLARRTGVEFAAGEFVFFVDSDDTIEHNALSLLCERQKETDAEIVIGMLRCVLEDWKVIQISDNKVSTSDSLETIISKIISKQIHASLCGRIIHKTLFESVYVLPEITIGEDFVTTLQLIWARNPKIALVNQVIYNYIQHSGSMVNNYTRKNARKRMMFMEWVNLFLEQNELYSKMELACGSFFLNEYYSFLRAGGLPKDNKEISFKVNQVYLSDKKYFYQVPIWRILLLKIYKRNVVLGKICMFAFLSLRRIVR